MTIDDKIRDVEPYQHKYLTGEKILPEFTYSHLGKISKKKKELKTKEKNKMKL